MNTETKTQHTPGPWAIDEADDGLIVTSPHRPDDIDDDVCLVYGGNNADRLRAIADARLIAAAPDLLEQLENFVECYEDPDAENTDPPYVYEMARAAIARATGA